MIRRSCAFKKRLPQRLLSTSAPSPPLPGPARKPNLPYSSADNCKERPRRDIALVSLANGPISYAEAWAWQKQLVAERTAARRAENLDKDADTGLRDVLLLLEHTPVYTLGRRSDGQSFLKFDPASPPAGCELHRVERGGDVTYHCPGQLVAYPIFDLTHYRRDLHWALRSLEEVVVRVVRSFGLQAERDKDFTGVWLSGGQTKVAALGLHASRWITSHGFALNVDCDLAGFDRIVPCGIEGRAVGSLRQFAPDARMEDVRARTVRTFEEVFNVHCVPTALADVLPRSFASS